MNIAFGYSSLRKGGAERVISSLANYFVSNDQVNIITLDNYDSEYELAPGVKHMKLDVSRKSVSLMDKFRSIRTQIARIAETVAAIQPDVIVAFDPKIADLCRRAVRGRIKVIGSERSNPYYDRKGFLSKVFVRASRKLDGFIFQTQGAKGYYPKKIQEKSIVIPNGIFFPMTATPLEYGMREKIICATGRVVPVKRYDVLIRAFGQIADQIPDYQVHIYGVGDEQERLEGLANELKIGDRVRFWGLCDRISDVLCRNRIFVLTSESEGMPNGLIEAMACGCACIASDCDFGPSELIREGENGVLFPVGDVDRLASALLEMATDRGKAERIARNAQKINDTLSIERIANQYHDYIEMIAQRGRE